MENIKHTPGPWKVNWGREGKTYPLSIWAMREDGFCNRSIVNAFGCQAQPETAANALLIAAAPELLETLKRLVADCQNLDISMANVDDADKAIAKAEGR